MINVFKPKIHINSMCHFQQYYIYTTRPRLSLNVCLSTFILWPLRGRHGSCVTLTYKTSHIWINDHSAMRLPNIEMIRTDHSLRDFVSLINIYYLSYYTFGFFKLFCCKPLFCFHGNSIQFWKLYILNYWTHQRGISPHFISLK